MRWSNGKSYYGTTTSEWFVRCFIKLILKVVLMHTTFWFLTSGAQMTLLPLLLVEKFDISTGTLGWLFSLIAISNVLGSQPAAWWSDKKGRKVAIVPGKTTLFLCLPTGALLVATVVGLLPLVQELPQLVGLVALWGVGNALIGTAPTAYLTDITTAKNRSQALALFRSGGDTGLLLGAGLSGFMAGFLGVGPSIVLNAALLGLVVGIFHKKAAEPREIVRKTEQK